MTDDESTDAISEIEAQIEELAESAERSRRIILRSKIAIAGGFALLLAALLGLFSSGETAALGAIALVLGGPQSSSASDTGVCDPGRMPSFFRRRSWNSSVAVRRTSVMSL